MGVAEFARAKEMTAVYAHFEAVNLISYSCVSFISMTFLVAGISKILRPVPFVSALRQYRVLPSALVRPVAISVPLLEVGLAIFLVLSKGNWLAASFSACLLLAFSVAMGFNLVQGRAKTPCGCGSLFGRGVISWVLVFRNILLAALAFAMTPFGTIIVGIGVVIGVIGILVATKIGSQQSRIPLTT
jgi:hypothetical protein